MKTFKIRAQRDVRVKRLFAAAKAYARQVNVARLLDEVASMHARRAFRTLTAEDAMRNRQNRLLKATLQNQAFRSRAVEIKQHCWVASGKLNRHVREVRRYLAGEYGRELAGLYRLKTERYEAVEAIIRPITRYVEELNEAIEIIDFIIEDLDKAAWTSKGVTDILNMSTRPERNI